MRASRLLAAGLGLVTVHLLDLAFSGPDTTVLGMVVIVAPPLAVWALWPRLGRVSRCALAVPLGIAFAAAATVDSVFDVFGAGPRWSDATGVACAVGGVLLILAGGMALATSASPRTYRVPGLLGWVVGAFAVGELVLLPLATALIVTHPVRLPVRDGAL